MWSGNRPTGMSERTKPDLLFWKVLKRLVEHIINIGKRSLTVQRYKGLGEMNPEQLVGNNHESGKKKSTASQP